MPFAVAVSWSRGKFNGTIVVVAPESTQMLVLLSSSVARSANWFGVVLDGAILDLLRCRTRSLLMMLLHEEGDM